MIKKSATELHFMRTNAPMATVEIDVHSVPPEHVGYGPLVEQALAGAAERWPALCATVYVYEGESINFGDRGYSAFFGVASDKRVLAALHAVLSGVRGLKVRYSDSILASESICQYHIEDEQVWRPWEEGTWYAGEVDDEDDEDDKDDEDDGLISEGFFDVSAKVTDGTNYTVAPAPVAQTTPEARIFAAARGRGQSRTGDWDKVFELLADYKIHPDTIVFPGGRSSLLTMAALEPAPDACERLLQLGADPAFGGTVGKRSVLTMMVWLRSKTWGKQHRRIVAMLALRTVNHQDSDGKTALMFASKGAGLFGMKRGNPKIIDELMRHGADPFLTDRFGLTALMHAVDSNDKSRTSANDGVIELIKSHSIHFAALQLFNEAHRVDFSRDGRMSIAPILASPPPEPRSRAPKKTRGDTLVATVTKRIEEHFDLPARSVALVDHKRRVLRDDDTLATLRDRHDA